MSVQITGNEVVEFIRNRCIEIASDASGWVSLFQELDTKAYWVRTYPDSQMQGGGLPLLTHVSAAKAKEDFDF